MTFKERLLEYAGAVAIGLFIALMPWLGALLHLG